MSDKVESGEKTAKAKHEAAAHGHEKPSHAKAAQEPVAAATEEPPAAKSQKSSFIVPLIIIAVFAGLVWLVVSGKIDLGGGISKPQMIPLESTQTNLPTKPTEPVPANTAPAEAKKTEAPTPPPAPKVEMRLDNRIARNEQPTRKVASSEEVQQLLDSINSLSNELQRVRGDQAAMQAALMQEQRINLEARLRWITDSASHLPQLQLAWEEIALLPGLSQDQQAETMLALAQKDSLLTRQWQMNLEKWANTLVTPTHENIIPKPEHPWLAWVAAQFSLSRAPSTEEEQLDGMRLTLLETSKRIALENWPDRQTWQTLRARLLLQLQQMQLAETGNTPELGLPENFDAIAKDIETLRETARQWLGENS